LPHGKGIFKYATGETYEGIFAHGMKEGYGVYNSPQ